MRFLCRADHGEIAKLRAAHTIAAELARKTAESTDEKLNGLRLMLEALTGRVDEALKAREDAPPAVPVAAAATVPAPVAEVPSPVLKPARVRRTAAAKQDGASAG